MTSFTPPQLEFLDICRLAYRKRASDIHVDPTPDGVAIRFRIDGLMAPIVEIPRNRAESFGENVKSLIGFDMAQYGVPQDTRFSHPDHPVDFRAALIPTLYGEKFCLRLLDRKKEFNLESLPLNTEAREALALALKKGQGLIIVSGPTGSGKSTLLYSALGSLDRSRKAIYTIEDPVEYSLSGLVQIPVNPPKLNFSHALRALMRQDPDVIMVGELRDLETAEVAIHAANTGHLVLTTVHANSVLDIANRLEALGVNRGLFETAILFASAQRLPTRLCKSCKVDDPESMKLARDLFSATITDLPKRTTGCTECGGSGVSGRVLLFEYLSSQKAASGRVLKKHDDLKDQALDYVCRGEMNVDEAYKCFSD